VCQREPAVGKKARGDVPALFPRENSGDPLRLVAATTCLKAARGTAGLGSRETETKNVVAEKHGTTEPAAETHGKRDR